MSAGHFLMAFDVTFLLALTCLLTGVGCFKGNLASQVGALYATGDNRRADAFQIYYLFINGGVIAAPLIAGTLGEVYGWHYGFGAAGVGMLIGLTIYLFGRKWLPPDSPVVVAEVGDPGRVEKGKRAPKPRLTYREKMAIIALLLLLPVLTIAVIGNQQIFNAYLVWAQDHANLVFFGRKMPTTWLITLDSILSVSCLAGAVVFWRLWSKKYPEPAEITKIASASPTSFRFRSHSTRASRRLHCPLPSSVSIIWLSLPPTISWAGSAAFWKKCQRPTSGFCTPHYAVQPASSSSSPAASSAISSPPATTRAIGNDPLLIAREGKNGKI